MVPHSLFSCIRIFLQTNVTNFVSNLNFFLIKNLAWWAIFISFDHFHSTFSQQGVVQQHCALFFYSKKMSIVVLNSSQIEQVNFIDLVHCSCVERHRVTRNSLQKATLTNDPDVGKRKYDCFVVSFIAVDRTVILPPPTSKSFASVTNLCRLFLVTRWRSTQPLSGRGITEFKFFTNSFRCVLIGNSVAAQFCKHMGSN